jgi:sugar phosphate isomerase/epimerase
MPHLTLGWLTLQQAAPEIAIAAAAEAGFRSVSIRITGRRRSDAFPDVVGHRAAIRNLRSQLREGGLRLSNTSIWHVGPDVALDDLRPALDATVELGARIVVATCVDSDHDRWVDFMARYAELAAGLGLTLALEFVPFSEAKTIGVAWDLVRRTGAPNFGLLIDALHLSRSGGRPADLAIVDPARIVFAQLCDAVAERPPHDALAQEARTGRLHPGDGALPLYEFLDALPAGVEIECEAPRFDHASLPPGEQARRAGDATRAFLARYCAARDKPMWE